MNITAVIGKDKIEAFHDHFWYLYDRWEDEKKYEDFGEYRKSAEDKFGYPLIKMTSRPFRAVFSVGAYEVIFHATNGVCACTVREKRAV